MLNILSFGIKSAFLEKVIRTIEWLRTTKVWKIPTRLVINSMNSGSKTYTFAQIHKDQFRGRTHPKDLSVFNIMITLGRFTYTLRPPGWKMVTLPNGTLWLFDGMWDHLPDTANLNREPPAFIVNQMLVGDDIGMPALIGSTNVLPAKRLDGFDTTTLLEDRWGFEIVPNDRSEQEGYSRLKIPLDQGLCISEKLDYVDYDEGFGKKRFAFFHNGEHVFDVACHHDVWTLDPSVHHQVIME